MVARAVGNYGEGFDRNLGPGTKLALDRGLNRLWSKGGIVYAPPVRWRFGLNGEGGHAACSLHPPG